ncbi:MAG: polysaccharide biosynthesis/export family protein [Deltaproteobacteria bacterium]|nr:polysaccharide biosynthesis/export family protein [Deltaproteobacteria bacterium]
MKLLSLCPTLLAIALISILAACASQPVVSRPLGTGVKSVEVDVLEDKFLPDASLPAESTDEAYRVGPGDSLLIAVFKHPDLSISSYAGAGAGAGAGKAGGVLVDNDGTIQFPMIGKISVKGKTTDEVREYLQAELKKYLLDPQVTVQIFFAGSHRYFMLGEFRHPGTVFGERPLRLLEAVAEAGGIVADAGLRGAYILRGPTKLPINLHRLLRFGDARHNIRLAPNDVVYVPDAKEETVYVFGEASKRVQMVHGRLNVLEALAMSGMALGSRISVDLDDVRVIRLEADRGTYFTVDAEAMIDGEAIPFQLEPGDIVYVPTTAITSWNQVLGEILPSLNSISALVQPYAFIRAVTR